MKIKKLAITVILATALAFSSLLPVPAADLNTASAITSSWLKDSLPSPGPGDALAMLALLRGGFITPTQEYTQVYLTSVVQNSDTAAAQPLAQVAWQILSMQAAGVSPAVYAPELVSAMANSGNLDAAGWQAQYLALVIFGTAGVPLAEDATLVPAELAARLAATAHQDGGFGSAEGSDPVSTGQAIQALAYYAPHNPEIQTTLENAQFWLQLNGNDHGGFDRMGENASPPIAEAMLAMSVLGYDPGSVGFESAYLPDALLSFQHPEGSFFTSQSNPSDLSPTSLCLLAMVAKTRFDRGKTGVFEFSDASPLDFIPAVPKASVPETSSLSVSSSQPPPDKNRPSLLLFLGSGGLLVLGLLLVFLFSQKKKGPPNRSNKSKHTYRRKM